MRDARNTQRAKILAELVPARGEWVPLPRVTQHAAQYNARGYELRRMGLTIKNKTQDLAGARHSWFRLGSSHLDFRMTPRPVPVQGSLELSAKGGL